MEGFMVLSWFRAAGKTEDVNALMARKDYKGAVGALRAQLQKDPENVFTRQQLADACVAIGDRNLAIGILEKLADDFARDGFAAKSISVLKKIQRLDPGRGSTDQRLAEAIQAKQLDDQKRMSLQSRPKKLESIDDFVPPVRTARSAPPPPQRPPVREMTPDQLDEVTEKPRSLAPESWLERVNAAKMRELEIEVDIEGDDSSISSEAVETAQRERDEVSSGTDLPAVAGVADTGESAMPKGVTTPLFRSFSADELVSVIQSFDLRTFEPGDIIVGEGEEGDSLFILTSGVVKAFVKTPRGHHRKVREMHDGDFFGEISFLKGGPRTATITAATQCDLLELNRSAVEELTEKHPNIRETLEEFSTLRAGSDAESAARSE
jgi:hypothetical protein